MANNLVYIAKITKPHGIRGQIKLISYASNPEDIFKYPHLYDDKLNEYKITLHSKNNNIFIASFNNNNSRNLAEEIAGTKLFITREMMPDAQAEEYYLTDLEGIRVLDTENQLKGHVLEIHNFGAGDIIEMKLLDKKDTIYLPFESEFIPKISLKDDLIIFDFQKAGITI